MLNILVDTASSSDNTLFIGDTSFREKISQLLTVSVDIFSDNITQNFLFAECWQYFKSESVP